MKTKRYFPMFIDLSDKNVVVVGGGNIATRRVKT
ncbi:MAG: NAD(P)-dependent oxidoreductase, partial [Blautia caecimuris]